jgi:CheY-like chemotaxis protein
LGTTKPTALRVLLVEPSKEVTDFLVPALRLWGHDPLAVNDAAKAVYAAGVLRPHVVILDLDPPGLDAAGTMAAVRQIPGLESATLVALSRMGATEDPEVVRQAGFAYCLGRPLVLPELEKVLASVAKGKP